MSRRSLVGLDNRCLRDEIIFHNITWFNFELRKIQLCKLYFVFCLITFRPNFGPISYYFISLANYHQLCLIIISKKILLANSKHTEVNFYINFIKKNHKISNLFSLLLHSPPTMLCLLFCYFFHQPCHLLAADQPPNATLNSQAPPYTIQTSFITPYSSLKWVNLNTLLVDLKFWFLFMLISIVDYVILIEITIIFVISRP